MISFKKKPFKKHLKLRKNKEILTLTPSLLAKISLFLTLKKIGFQIDPLPPFRKSSLLKPFIFLIASLGNIIVILSDTATRFIINAHINTVDGQALCDPNMIIDQNEENPLK